MKYIKGNQTIDSNTFTYGDKLYIGASSELIQSLGFIEVQEFNSSIPEVKQPTYDETVVSKIREKYSLDDEIAILRQRDSKPDEFAAYNKYCEQCKTLVKDLLHLS